MPSLPFPSTTLNAVSACTRTLADAPDADVALSRAAAATLGGLRAYADRLAVRRRWHDEQAYLAHRPDEDAGELYDALTDARLDALGVRWLPGIAHNLLAHPGPAPDGVRWLAFSELSGRLPPAERRLPAERVREQLAAPLVSGLTQLRERLDDAPAFATAAAAWAREAAGGVPRASITSGTGPRIPLTRAPGGSDIRRGRYARPGAATSPTPAPAESSSEYAGVAPAHDGPPDASAAVGYHAYTTAHDRVINAAALASRDELAALRLKMDAEFGTIRSTVARVAKRLMRVLMARQAREWRFDLDDGLLDPARLTALVASRGVARPFKQEFDSPFPSTVVTLLIDHSGSMRGRPMQIAALTVEIFARVLERCQVQCEVLGFTTREWDGGAPARQWADDGYPGQPGRLNALEHILIKPASVPWRRARVALGLFLRDDMLKENIDGEALAWAHARLLARPERRRILVVVSDGTPMDEATFAANGIDYLDDHLAAVVQQIEQRSPVQLAAIGIGHDVSRFYRNATRISRIDDLGPALTAKLLSLLADPHA